ncbi:hypothetical protein ACC732_28455 [Rhizobium ruizarguesonis]
MLPTWMANGPDLLIFSGVFFATFHILFYILGSETARNIGAYVAILLGGFAILTSYVNSEGVVNAQKSELLSTQVTRVGLDVEDQIERSENYLCGFPSIKLPTSPDNFDAIETDRLRACDVAKLYKQLAAREWRRGEQAFPTPDIGQATVTDRVWRQSLAEIERVADSYNALIAESQALKPRRWLLWAASEPFIISFSWCLGLSAVFPLRKRGRK